MTIHYIYKILNKINAKIYFGQTIHPEQRWKEHIKQSKCANDRYYIHNAIHKYGENNFTFEIVDTCSTQEEANDLEGYCIKKYNTLDSRFGYNLMAGGAHSDVSEETRLKMKLGQLGKKHPKEVVDKRRQALAKTNKQKQEEKLKTGEWKCFAPGCEKQGPGRYRILDGVRYCNRHAEKLIQTGTLEKLPLRGMPKGNKPHNARKFTQEELDLIINDPRGTDTIGEILGCTGKVIRRIRNEYGIAPISTKKNFTSEQMNAILQDKRGINKIAKDYGVSPIVISRIRKENGVNPISIKKQFNDEQMQSILDVNRSTNELARELDVDRGVISRIRLENNIQVDFSKRQFTQEQINSIISDTRPVSRIAKDFGCTPKVIDRVRRDFAHQINIIDVSNIVQ